MDKPKTKGWYSTEHETSLHPTVVVQEKERPTLYTSDGREIVVRHPVGFVKK